MANLTVRNIPEKDYAELQQDAKQNRRSINARSCAFWRARLK